MSDQSQWFLKVSDDAQFNQITPIPPGRIAVGSANDADLRVQALGVSRRHAVIDSSMSVPVVDDLDSVNGTWVNGVKIAGPVALHNNDLIHLGKASLRVTLIQGDTSTRSHPVVGEEKHSRPQHGSFSVTGPMQYGDGRQNTAYQGDVNAPTAGGFVHVNRGRYAADRQSFHRTSMDFEYPEAVAFRTKGFARIITVIGLLIALLGFGLFMSEILSGSMSGGGFAIFIAGGCLYALGVVIANVQNFRHKELEKRKHGNMDEEW